MTAFAGVMRVVTLCFLLGGTVFVAPSYYWNEDASLWMIPAGECLSCAQSWPCVLTVDRSIVAFGASIPFAAAVASGPIICSIRAVLPQNARSSKEELIRFANNVPTNARLKVQFIRFVPWLTTREMYFSELRRLPPSSWRLANLEYVAADEVDRMAQLKWWQQGMLKSLFCRFYVPMSTRDRSAVKGVWDKMWKQIPPVGYERVAAVTGEERRPVVMRNRGKDLQSAPAPLVSPPASRTRKQ